MAAEGYGQQQEDSMMNRGTSEMIPMGLNYNYGVTSGMNMMLPLPPGNSSTATTSSIICSPGIVQPCNSSLPSSSHLFDGAPSHRQDTGLAAEWSVEEQYRLKEGLEMYANEPSIMKYIKIAAYLRDKTVRDVAVRCRWMTSKRRKPEEHNMGKKVDRKDKLVESSSNANMPSAILQNMVTYPLMVHQMDQNERISGTTSYLLEQNARDFDQIRDNLSIYRLQDNIDLFYRTRNNIAAILIDMRETPGIMSQMPPLPVSVNDDLANSLLPSSTQTCTQRYTSGPTMEKHRNRRDAILKAKGLNGSGGLKPSKHKRIRNVASGEPLTKLLHSAEF